MWTALDILFGFVGTWVVGLSPAIIARYVWKKAPLSGWSASLIAGLSCVVFAFAFLIARSAAGETDARLSPAWILVFIVSRFIMTRETKTRRTRDEIIFKLQEMVVDPESTEEQRSFANDRLGQYQSLSSKNREKEVATSTAHLTKISSRSPYVRIAVYALGLAFILDGLLMASGYRLLVREKVLNQGEFYATGDWEFGSDERSVIVCWYWTGRSLKPQGFIYGLGRNERDECTLLYDPSSDK